MQKRYDLGGTVVESRQTEIGDSNPASRGGQIGELFYFFLGRSIDSAIWTEFIQCVVKMCIE